MEKQMENTKYWKGVGLDFHSDVNNEDFTPYIFSLISNS